MGPGDLADDGQPEAGAGRAERAGGVEADEALEDPFPPRLRHAWPVVGDLDDDRATVVAHAEGHGTGRVALGIVGKVGDEAAQLVPVAEHPPGPDAADRDVDAAVAPQAVGLGQHHLVDVHLVDVQRNEPLVESGQGQQVGDERGEPPDLGDGTAEQRRRVRSGVGGGHLQLGAQRGKRVAQLVGDVGDQRALALGGGLQPIQHGVHGVGQPADLVAPGRLGHPAVELGRHERLHLGADRLHRSERPAGEHGDEPADHEEHDREQHGEGEARRVDGMVAHPERVGDEHGARCTGLAEADGGHGEAGVARQGQVRVAAAAQVEQHVGRRQALARGRAQRHHDGLAGDVRAGCQHGTTRSDHLCGHLLHRHREAPGQVAAQLDERGDVERLGGRRARHALGEGALEQGDEAQTAEAEHGADDDDGGGCGPQPDGGEQPRQVGAQAGRPFGRHGGDHGTATKR